jgi:hypothetical protein
MRRDETSSGHAKASDAGEALTDDEIGFPSRRNPWPAEKSVADELTERSLVDESIAVIDQTFPARRERLSTVFLFLKCPADLLGGLFALPQTLRLRQVLGGKTTTPPPQAHQPNRTPKSVLNPKSNAPKAVRQTGTAC